jgi:hypothetical protein
LARVSLPPSELPDTASWDWLTVAEAVLPGDAVLLAEVVLPAGAVLPGEAEPPPEEAM